MHVAIETMEMGNIFMEISMHPYHIQVGFDLRNGGGQVGTFNEPCEGQAQALSLALVFLGCHLFVL